MDPKDYLSVLMWLRLTSEAKRLSHLIEDAAGQRIYAGFHKMMGARDVETARDEIRIKFAFTKPNHNYFIVPPVFLIVKRRFFQGG